MLWIRGVFWLGAVYNVVIGLGFLVLGNSLFERFHVPPPNHPGYYEFPAMLLVIFGVLFGHIATNPLKHRRLMLYAMALKASYASLILYHHVTDGVPSLWYPFAFGDLAFLVLIAVAYVVTGRMEEDPQGRGAWG